MKLGINLGSLIVLFVAVASFAVSPAIAKKGVPDLVKLCKKECPEAKDLKATMECVETKEHAGGADSDKFKKSKCYTTHEAHETEYHKMAGTTEHDEAGGAEKK